MDRNALKKIMTQAWTLAKAGAARFGGSPVEYLAESLRIAWKEQNMRQTISWQTSKGMATVVVHLQTSKTINADGDLITVPTCDLHITATVEGLGLVGSGRPQKLVNHPSGAVATIGKLALRAENLLQVQSAIAMVEATPEWQAHLVADKKAEQAWREADAHRAMMRKVMGY